MRNYVASKYRLKKIQKKKHLKKITQLRTPNDTSFSLRPFGRKPFLPKNLCFFEEKFLDHVKESKSKSCRNLKFL